MLTFFTPTTTYSQPLLSYGSAGADPAIDIPMVLDSYTVPSGQAKTAQASGIPYINVTQNNTTGGLTLMNGGQPELPKINISGFMDTPTEQVGEWRLPALYRASIGLAQRVTYADIVNMNFGGYGGQFAVLDNGIVDPIYWRDPYGRIFWGPRITAFTSSYVEAVPGRTTFQMTLALRWSSNA